MMELVIGANAVVTHNVGPYEIWAGIPAKKIGQRFDNKTINRLLKIKWWDFPESILEKHLDLFSHKLTEEILNEIEAISLTYTNKITWLPK